MSYTDYGEIFCQAVSDIVKGEISNLPYDMSKECTIIRINNKSNGKYQVSDGSMSFEAQAGTGDYYDVGDQVIVTIPQGDYNKQISILNKIVDDWSGPGGFVRPLDTIIQCTDNVAIDVNPTSLTANKNPNKTSELDSNASSVQILNLSNKMFYGFSRVAVVADFKTLLSNLNVVTGDYGLIFDLIENKTEVDSNGNVQRGAPKKVLTYQFSCNDMLGNPYEFSTYFQQEYAFDIPVNFTVHDVKVYFYQNGQFKNGNNTLIAAPEYANLFVQNLQIYFGYARDIEIKDSVELTSDYLSYNNLGTNWRYLYLQWFHKTGENNLKQITSVETEATSSAYSVRWYRHKQGAKGDDYGGSNWEHINSTAPTWVTNKDTGEPYTDYPFVMKWDMDENLTQEKFKVVALVKTYPLSNDPTYEVIERYDSNTLVFENTSESSGGGENAEDTIRDNLTLHFHDGSYGNYFIYDQNGLLINSAEQGQSKNRVLELMYYGEPVDKDSTLYPDIASIEWGIPEQGKYSMIMYDLEQTNGTFTNPKNELLTNDKWQYIYREFGDSDSQWSTPQSLTNRKFSIVDNKYKFREIYAVQTFKCSNNGTFSFVGALKLFNNSTDKDLAKKLDIVLSFIVWTSTDGKSWYETSTQPIQTIASYMGGNEYAFTHNFSLNRPHTHMRVGIGFKRQSRDNWPSYKKSGETEYTALTEEELKKIDWNIEINSMTDTVWPSFKSKSALYTNTSYPGEDKILNTSFNYSILNSYTQERNNNTIRCVVNLKSGKRCELTETLRFGPKGSSGTSNTFILEILENKNALIYDDDDDSDSKELKIEAVLINNTGKKVYFSEDEAAKIEWKLLNNTNSLIQLDKQYDVGQEKDPIVLLKYVNNNKGNEQELLQENYVILQASYVYYKEDEESKTKPILHAFLPIPIRSKKCYGKSGPNQIIYNHLGVPAYGENPYIAYTSTIDANGGYIEKEHRIWQLKQDNNNPNPVYFKIVRENKDKNANPFECSLVPSPLYTSIEKNEDPIQDKVCVYCLEDNTSNAKILWSQPILIMQSSYDFAMLNSWDGRLTIDEENGTILATMLGAGRKNSQNEFSGVLIGDVKGGTGLQSTVDMTGVYGFKDGIMTYGLRENGSAFFGAQHGRIEIDGTSGIIRSAGWYKDSTSWKLNTTDDNKIDVIDGSSILKRSTGTLLDLDDGKLLMYGGNNSYLNFNKDGDGKLEMSLNGANIILTDKTNNPSLTGYIDITAKGLTSEFRKTAIYAVTCDTADKIGIKVLNLSDFSKYAFNSDDKTDTDNKINDLTIEDLYQDGLTIAVTFTNAETVDVTPVEIKQKIDGTERVIGYKEKRTGRALYFSINNDKKPIYLNGKATNDTPSLKNDNTNNNASNSFGWTKGSTIYFTYRQGYWAVSDSGSYSRITQTADTIKSEVSNVAGTLGSSITQTANSITSEVRRIGGYKCEADWINEDGGGWKMYIKATKNNGDPYGWSDLQKDKNVIAVTFSGAGTSKDTVWLKDTAWHAVYLSNKETSSTNSLTWDKGATLYFSYDASKTYTSSSGIKYKGAWIVVDSGAYSKITQTADAINTSVFGENGLKSSLELSINGLRTEVFGTNGLQSSLELSIDGLRTEVFGPNGLKTSLETSINGVNATVTGKLDPTGTFGSCGWSITTNGFNVYKKVGNETTNLFNVDTSGNATFAGNLTATTTQFQSLQAGAVSINGTNYYSSFNAQHIEIVVGTDKNNDTGVYTNGGKLIIGAPNYSTYDDVSLYARVINETQGQVGYGNLGLPDKKWDTLSYVSIGSKRNFKQDVQVYNIEQAYEELKTLPIYTYKYKGNGDSSRTLSLGSMIDYMPIEFMRTTYTEDGTIFEPNNIIFWNIAAAQVMQSKLENIIDRVEQLELKEVN